MIGMRKNGQRAIREKYSWEVMERKMLSSYMRLCGKCKMKKAQKSLLYYNSAHTV